MTRLTVLLACCLALGATSAPAQETFHAILNTGDYPLLVDSLGRQSPDGTDTIPTPGFGGPRETVDTFGLETVELALQYYVFYSIEGQMQETFVIDAPEPDQIYEFPLDGPAWMMFVFFEPGIQELPGSPVTGLFAAPNPFSRTTTISWQLPAGSKASVEVLDVSGRLVRRLASGVDASRSVTWDGRDESGARVASGVYLVRALTGRGSALNKLVLTD